MSLAGLIIISLCVGLSIVAANCAIVSWVQVWLLERDDRKRADAKAKARTRAPVIHVGDRQTLNGWRFYLRPGSNHFSGKDPLTGKLYIFGYDQDELSEIASRPSEFEQPDLEWFVKEE